VVGAKRLHVEMLVTVTAAELKGYDLAKATIRFRANKPLPRRARDEARQGAHRGERDGRERL